MNNQVEIRSPVVDKESTTINNKIRFFSGKTVAAAHAVFVAGLLWILFPECDNQQTLNVMHASAKNLNKTNKNNKNNKNNKST